MGLVLALFGATNVYAQSTVELPYSITFDSTNDVWTVLDASPTPGTSWEFNNDWGNDGFCIGNAWTAHQKGAGTRPVDRCSQAFCLGMSVGRTHRT